ncbi:DUF6630 family protein [Enterococcus sp. BWR-S5]|uniref:DUF6630 family protein n=1 Tax=Enterococcus sp. BWR-S5 TaxID=2787714 RepID=UPI0019227FB4|nr:hypothetical protein [Enterococcus sp. BWR-S5]MBL1226329.1 hypothetical protein [Enterococcus sp. BWR-S5]
MGFLKRLFGKGESMPQPAPTVEEEIAEKNQEEDRAAYLALVRLLSQENERAAQGMLYAFDEPELFLKQYQEMFANWFSNEMTVEELAAYPIWELFCYVLYDEGYLGITDWKSEAEDFIYYAEKTVKKYDMQLDYSKITDKEEMAPEFFEQLKQALPTELALLDIDIDSDSYQLTVIPVEKAAAVRELTERIGGKINWY